MIRVAIFLHLVVIGGGFGATTAGAISEEAPSIEILTFDRFIATSGPVCERRSARACFALAFDFADANGDGGLSSAEVAGLRDALEDWSAWRSEALTRQEAGSIRLGLWLVDAVGLDALHTSYDADEDGRVSREELLADVRLDDRPMADVLLDPAAVDRAAVARRLGALNRVLEQALPDPGG